jgi:hypothetical protein
MKAREHLQIHLMILVVVLILTYFLLKERFFEILNFNLLIGIGLYFLGAILPDSDSNNKGSYIYSNFKNEPLYYLAHLISWIELPLSKFVTNRPIKHRESLHTIIGIITTSLFVIILVSIIYYFIYKSFLFYWFLIWFVILFVSQFLHLIEDLNKRKYPNWKIIFF